MHPLNHVNFGASGIAAIFYDGFTTKSGYILKQHSQNRFDVTDGTVIRTGIYLAPTTDIATAIGISNPDYFTIPVYSQGNGSGAIFDPLYVPSILTPWPNSMSTGTGYLVGDVVSITGGARGTVTAVTGNGRITNAIVSYPGSGAGTPNPLPITFYSGGTAFLGSIAGNVLTVISMTSGTVLTTQLLAGAGISAGTVIGTQLTGTTGDVGTYHLNHTLGTIGPEMMTSHGQPAFFEVGYVLNSIEISGDGVDYRENDTLLFPGIIADLIPTAYISSVSDGVPEAVTITAGNNISLGVGADSVYTAGPVEYVKTINEKRLTTIEGGNYYWSLGISQAQAFIPTYNLGSS